MEVLIGYMMTAETVVLINIFCVFCVSFMMQVYTRTFSQEKIM